MNEWCRQLGKDNVLLISIHCNAAARRHLPGHRLRTDCAFLLSPEGQQSLVDLHVDGICVYLEND